MPVIKAGARTNEPQRNADQVALVMLSDILAAGFECGVLNGQVQPGDTAAIVGGASVGGAVLLMRTFRSFRSGAIKILTWGGLRGGISVALALSIPAVPERTTIVVITYIVVVFSIGIQGMTLGRLVERIYPGVQGHSDEVRP